MSHAGEGIYAVESERLGRAVQLGIASGKVINVSFPEAPDAGAQGDHPLLARIERYLAGEQEDFADVDVGLTVPTDQRAVLEKVRTIPYGESVTVDQLARMAPGLDPEEDRAVVRTALAENPVPLVIPDHRVRDGPGATPSGVAAGLRSIEGL